MTGPVPTKPGWYRNPDDPRSLRYWDGSAWSGRPRGRPPWSSRADPFELTYDELDRSVEGPVHPHELREPVTSGAWSREWLSWRPRQAVSGWHRGAGSHPSRASRPPRAQPPAKLGPARRPVLALVCLMVISVGVVVSSVAFISPYETNGVIEASDQAAAARFTAQVDRECMSTLPQYRGVLAWGTNGASVGVAAHQVGILRERLASIKAPQDLRGPFEEWLLSVQQFVAEQVVYASIVGSPERLSNGRVAERKLAPAAQVAAGAARRQTAQLAAAADNYSRALNLDACRLSPIPAD